MVRLAAWYYITVTFNILRVIFTSTIFMLLQIHVFKKKQKKDKPPKRETLQIDNSILFFR